MFRPRVIPCLLLKDGGLVKTINFDTPTYIGDPINAVKIFNDYEVDELVFLDIEATNEHRTIDLDLVEKIGDEAFMPFAVGGGIKDINAIKNILKRGAEKVVLNSITIENPSLVKTAANLFGNQSIIVSIDVKRISSSEYKVFMCSGKQNTGLSPVEHAKRMEKYGAGEILINSIDKDGALSGYDIELIKQVTEAVNIPVVALGGAKDLQDFGNAVYTGGASAVAAGSIFVFIGKNRAVLINYPDNEDLWEIFNK